MSKELLIAVLLIFSPAICYASLPGIIGDAFGRGGPMYPATLILGISIGSWLLKMGASVLGVAENNIRILEKVAKVSIVISAVYAMLKTIFELLGI